MNLSVEIAANFKSKSCRYFAAPFDVRMSLKNKTKETTIVQPDLCVICDESKLDAKGCYGSPDLIIKIISQGNSKHDVSTKFKLYEETNVKEYWIVEPYDKIVLIYTLIHGKYIGLKPFSIDEMIESSLFPDIQISINDIFYKLQHQI